MSEDRNYAFGFGYNNDWIWWIIIIIIVICLFCPGIFGPFYGGCKD